MVTFTPLPQPLPVHLPLPPSPLVTKTENGFHIPAPAASDATTTAFKAVTVTHCDDKGCYTKTVDSEASKQTSWRLLLLKCLAQTLNPLPQLLTHCCF